jgi:hypothetical protein
MFDRFDPYDALIAMDVRLGQLTDAHNNLARAFEEQKQDLTQVIESLQNLQKAHFLSSESVKAIGMAINVLLEEKGPISPNQN